MPSPERCLALRDAWGLLGKETEAHPHLSYSETVSFTECVNIAGVVTRLCRSILSFAACMALCRKVSFTDKELWGSG